MKYILIAILCVIFICPVYSQDTMNLNKQLTKQDYLRKSKGQMIAGLAFLAAGITSILLVANGEKSFDTTGTVVIIGGVVTLSSIPFLIASGKNKKRAKAAVAL